MVTRPPRDSLVTPNPVSKVRRHFCREAHGARRVSSWRRAPCAAGVMCICGFVCVPLIAFFGAGAAGIGAPAIVAGMEKNGKAGATATDVSTNDCGKSEDEVGAKDSPLKTLCEIGRAHV